MFVRGEEMNAVTQCPACSTRFRVSQEQLDAHGGMVRCGRCQAAFNALEYLSDNDPSPQLDLPIMQEETATDEPATDTPDLEVAHSLPETPHADSLDFSGAHAVPTGLLPTEDATGDETATTEPEITPPTEAEEFLVAKSKEKRPAWPWAVASIVLLLVMILQSMYFFRVELAARMPGLKPLLVSYCNLLQCRVTLPRETDLVSIESSDLEADPTQASVITLTATLRNRASYAQAYPSLELTLNDINDKPVARRIFHPADYLLAKESENLGLAGRREFNIKLRLDTSDLKPSGYRLLLFYPK